MNNQWTTADIPDLTGKVIIITGANSGIGYASAMALAPKGATIILACRNTQKGNIAFNNIKLTYPKAKIDLIKLDLAHRKSIERFVETFTKKYARLDVLMNNAGLMGVFDTLTRDGYDMQLGVNHLGHFILTALLLPTLQNTPESRIVHLSSMAASNAKIHFEDMMFQKKKASAMKGYAQSKLAVLLFGLELHKRLDQAGSHIKSIPVHPGFSTTKIIDNSKVSSFFKFIARGLSSLIAQDAEMGALPQLFAAVAPEAEGGKYYGPDGKGQQKGYPTELPLPNSAQNEEDWKKLWQLSEKITGLKLL